MPADEVKQDTERHTAAVERLAEELEAIRQELGQLIQAITSLTVRMGMRK